jgi:hypothetical protein
LEKSHRDIQLEQVRVCTEIGIECIEYNPAKRPVSMQHIIARLHETGSTEDSVETDVTRSSPLQVMLTPVTPCIILYLGTFVHLHFSVDS